jgi:hypothetical protein
MTPFGGDVKPISSDVRQFANEARPTWAPDRLRVAYSHFIAGFFQIFVANADGSNATNISSGSADEIQPAWSPTGSKIAFTRFDESLGKNQLYVRNTDGTGIARLSDKTADDSYPCWSPDGSQIAFQRFDSGSSSNEIFIMNASGSGAHRFANFGGSQPAWSPDGKSIAFVLSNDIFAVSVASPGNSSEVAFSADAESEPTWAPDSKSIAYSRGASDGQGIWVSDLNGGNPHEISVSSGFGDVSPCWSPPPVKKTLVGSGGSLGTAAAGFLFGLSGEKVTSVLAFNSSAPDSVTVTTNENPDPGSDNIIFNISGALNSIKFYNQDAASVTILPSGSSTSATGAVVAFDATTGVVATVIPFTASRAATGRTQVHGGILHGTFLGVYDSTGRNLAPGGTDTVRLESKTGKVLAVH